MTKQNYDIVIVGSGLVGASLAYALKDLPLNIAIIDAVASTERLHADFDARSLALSYSSQRIFSSLGLWPDLAPHALAIEQVHVSDQGHFGITRFSAKQQGVAALGYLIELQALNQCLDKALQQMTALDVFCPATLTQLDYVGDGYQLQLTTADGLQLLHCDLLIAADGARSTARDLLNIKNKNYDYQQHAIVANIGLQRPHQQIAYERFTAQGPIAMLPMSQQRAAMVWTVPSDQVQTIMQLDDQSFLQQLQKQFGYRLGRFIKVGQRQHFPLQLVQAERDHDQNAVLIGNAAHSLHPIAGQGFNLGLRDVSVLAQVIYQHYQPQQTLPVKALITDYSHWQTRDQRRMADFTHTIARLFSNDHAPLSLVRNLGLTAIDYVTPLRDEFAKLTMGMTGKLSDLVCGIGLKQVSFLRKHESRDLS